MGFGSFLLLIMLVAFAVMGLGVYLQHTETRRAADPGHERNRRDGWLGFRTIRRKVS